MKRTKALELIANQLDFLNGKFAGVRTDFTEEELKNADVILTTVEDFGMAPPIDPTETYYSADEAGGYSPRQWEDWADQFGSDDEEV